MSKTKKPAASSQKVTKTAPAAQQASKKTQSKAEAKAPAKASAKAASDDASDDIEDEIDTEVAVETPVAAAPAAPADATPQSDDEDFYLTDAEGNRYCRVRDCDQVSTVDSYCRYHYLLLWKKIQVRKKILTDGKLEFYIVELTSRYPDKFLEMIRRDLRTQKDFVAAIQELEIDESGLDNDFEEEDTQYIDEVRGMGTGGGGGNETESVEDEF